jgi:hypothetical protein
MRHMAAWNEKPAQSVLIRIAIWRNLRFLLVSGY